jgi:phosphatidylserine decarboxylase
MPLRERIAFWRQFRADFETTGAVQPSSRFLARAMAEPIRHRRAAAPDVALSILELGPGTGAVTAGVVAAMGADDRLDCYEINPRFVAFLRGRIDRDPTFASARDRVVVHCRAAQDVPSDARYDFVVCSVPLNNLDAEVVDAIFDAGFRVLRDAGTFTYFEYPVLPSVKATFAPRHERERIRAVSAIKSRRADRHGRRSRVVLLNLPPARACHLGAPSGETATSRS